MIIRPTNKIKVFISSRSGVEKYDEIRAELKKCLEATNLFRVYTFESSEASTLSAEEQYLSHLLYSDVCIFLIDNKDGISSGVRKELNWVDKRGIKALYYFCNENSKEKTDLEIRLRGANYPKYKTVNKFSDLWQCGGQGLVEDIIHVYKLYCRDVMSLELFNSDKSASIDIADAIKYPFPTMSKTTLGQVDKCSRYLIDFILSQPWSKAEGQGKQTSAFDLWGFLFLPVLLEGQSIRNFDVQKYLDFLSNNQDPEYHKIVCARWKAIQAYFTDDEAKCIEHLNVAKELAISSSQPAWVIDDILIDLRNRQFHLNFVSNGSFDTSAQEELDQRSEQLYYPTIDRLSGLLRERIINDLYQKKTDSPQTLTFGEAFDEYGAMLAGYLVVAMYNGSLTHILQIYKNIREVLFYLTFKYDTWVLKFNLYKLAIFEGSAKEIKGIQSSHPDILNKLSKTEAASLLAFCNNHPLSTQRLHCQLLALNAVGYFLDDQDFDEYLKVLLQAIANWLEDAKPSEGRLLFTCLKNLSARISHDTLSDFCCQIIEHHYYFWYLDLARFMATSINLNKMSKQSAQRLIDQINKVLDDPEGQKSLMQDYSFLAVLRMQNILLTQDMDARVSKYLPQYYQGDYMLITGHDNYQTLHVFIKDCAETIEKHNEESKHTPSYLEWGTREFATVRDILQEKDLKLDADLLDRLILATTDMLLHVKASVELKLDATSLLTCIAIKYPESYKQNISLYNDLFEQRAGIEVLDYISSLSNVESPALSVGLQLLFNYMGKDIYPEMLESLTYLQDDLATTIKTCEIINTFLKNSDDIMLQPRIESIILQHVLQWLQSQNTDLRYYAAKLLLSLSRNPENSGIINQQLINIIDSGSPEIKLLIIRNFNKIPGITQQTKTFIANRCRDDSHYLVRTSYSQMERTQSK